MRKLIIPPLISVCIIITTICTKVIAGGLHTEDEIILSTTDKIEENEQYEGINPYEETIINQLSYGLNIADSNYTGKNENGYAIYIKYLKDYIGTPDLDIEKAQADKIYDKIPDLIHIMTLEQNNSFQEMSLDGREIAIQLAKEIYALCGLEIEFDMQGNIVQITDHLDKNIYHNKSSKQSFEFQNNVFFSVLLLIILMFGNCVLVAKKNKILIRGGEYFGFKKKRYV